ncbi:unnamed protein product [Bursaphelenchus xylophilus]|uniref:(pine wood nematode) hypothetical protein n=1 Tax=Bursaphelenchus xylophilus TaxID=6326 RepID=A0A1I7SG01_BURXY|nr:unnamed protein product [Bursaphelenchus xylophilus]CAG9120832.1 unnamed protein product [Bursaphelenchus xylophilus]
MMTFGFLLLLLPLCYGGYLSSDDILRNVKKAHPDRTYVKLSGDDFETYAAIAIVGNENGPINEAKLNRSTSFADASIHHNETFEAEEHYLIFPLHNDEFFHYTIQLSPSGRYRQVDFEHDSTYIRCQTMVNSMTPQLRERVFAFGHYISINQTHAVHKDDNCNVADFNQARKTFKYDDLPINISKQIRDTYDLCWDPKNTDKYCVQDLYDDELVLVPRKLPLYHTLNATVYAECCGGTWKCDKYGSRCSNFIYDHITGVDYYFDDQSDWTIDSFKRPLFLIAEITNSTKFHTVTRKNYKTSTTTTTTTPAPKSAPPQPSGNCCGRFSFFFEAIFG